MQWTNLSIRSAYGINSPITLKHEKDLTADGNVLINVFGHFTNSLIVKDIKNWDMKFETNSPNIYFIQNCVYGPGKNKARLALDGKFPSCTLLVCAVGS